jgi:ribosomal protein S18 acetylase RimI-like enzyme
VTDQDTPTVTTRAATEADAPALARLHATRISEGFLPTLGDRFLTKLYRRIARFPDACAYVVEVDDTVVAFAAGAMSVGRLYREFLLRDGISAGFVAAPKILRSAKHVWETLRYPGTTAELPAAEVLSVATAADAGGRGYGRSTVDAVTAELARRGALAVKVTFGADNAAALALYTACDFVPAARVEVHDGTVSEVLVWTAP